MLIILLGYILPLIACLGLTYCAFRFCATEGEGERILLLILLSFVPVLNIYIVLQFVVPSLDEILVLQIEKQIKKRRKNKQEK